MERENAKTHGGNEAVAVIATCLALLAASILFVVASRGDLWLDEIHSLAFAEYATNAWELFTRFKNDNNHLLNSLFLYLLGPQTHFPVYRLLSVLSGIGSLLILWRLARDRGSLEALFTVLLAGSSYPLILYFSEARGYAPAIFFTLLAYMQLERCRNRFTLPGVALFWMAAVLGLLAHFTSIVILAAMACSSMGREYRSGSSLQKSLLRLAALYALPAASFLALYVFFIRHMAIGGGDSFAYGDVFRRASAVLVGAPDGQLWGSAALLLYISVVIAGTWLLYRTGDDRWQFYPLALLVFPLLMLAATRPQVLYFRYFISCFPFFYLLCGTLLGMLCRNRATGYRWAAVALIMFMAAGHVTRVIPLCTHGRGNYSDALAYIAARTPGPVIRIGSDHDYRNGMLLSFYSRFLTGGKKLQYVNQDLMSAERPEWIITHSQERAYLPQEILALEQIGVYRLVQRYPYADDSGWNWFVYRRESTVDK